MTHGTHTLILTMQGIHALVRIEVTQPWVIVLLNGMPVYWRSNKQPITSVSSACAEIYALREACRDVRLIAWVAEDMGREVPWPMVVYVDNAAGVSF